MDFDVDEAVATEEFGGTWADIGGPNADAIFGKENASPPEASKRRSSILTAIAKGFSTPKKARRNVKIKPRANSPGPIVLTGKLSKSTITPSRGKRRRPSLDSANSNEQVDFVPSELTYESCPKKRAVDRVPNLPSTPVAFRKRASLRDSQGAATPPCKPRMAIKEYQSPKMMKCQPKEQQLWVNTVDHPDSFSAELIKRQEAIYEINLHAQSMHSDAKTVIDNYMQPMKKLKLLGEEDEEQLFGKIRSFLLIHEEIVGKLRDLRNPDNGTTECVGETLMECFALLRDFIPFCANLQLAKVVYDRISQEPGVSDFLERCRKSSFSNKRSLWDFLDSQRSNLLKYPLLLKSVLHRTTEEHADHAGLRRALSDLEEMLAEMDKQTGAVKSAEVLKRLSYSADAGRCPVVDSSSSVICSGTLRCLRGQRAEVSKTILTLLCGEVLFDWTSPQS